MARLTRSSRSRRSSLTGSSNRSQSPALKRVGSSLQISKARATGRKDGYVYATDDCTHDVHCPHKHHNHGPAEAEPVEETYLFCPFFNVMMAFVVLLAVFCFFKQFAQPHVDLSPPGPGGISEQGVKHMLHGYAKTDALQAFVTKDAFREAIAQLQKDCVNTQTFDNEMKALHARILKLEGSGVDVDAVKSVVRQYVMAQFGATEEDRREWDVFVSGDQGDKIEPIRQKHTHRRGKSQTPEEKDRESLRWKFTTESIKLMETWALQYTVTLNDLINSVTDVKLKMQMDALREEMLEKGRAIAKEELSSYNAAQGTLTEQEVLKLQHHVLPLTGEADQTTPQFTLPETEVARLMEMVEASIDTALKAGLTPLDEQITQANQNIETAKDEVAAANAKTEDTIKSMDARVAALENRSEGTVSGEEVQKLQERVQVNAGALQGVSDMRGMVNQLNEKVTALQQSVGGAVDNKELTVDHIREIVRGQLEVFAADRTGRQDFALLTTGGRVIDHSPSFNQASATDDASAVARANKFLGWLMLARGPTSHADWALDTDMSPGHCWSMAGQGGYMVIELREPVIIDAVTIQHVSHRISAIYSSAPKGFEVYGLREGQEPVLLVADEYEGWSERTVQPFPADNPGQEWFTHVRVKITSNQGNPDYTCLYRVRIHGTAVTMRHSADEPGEMQNE